MKWHQARRWRRGRASGWVIPLLAFALCAAPAGALTLADLANGASITSHGVTYSDFTVKVRGKGLSKNLADYQVENTSLGFLIDLAVRNDRKNGKLGLRYTATGSNLVQSGLRIEDGGEFGKVRAGSRLKGIGKLKVNFRKDVLSDLLGLPNIDSAQFSSKIKSKGGGAVEITGASALATPEPSTALLLAGGLVATALRRRRARA